MCTRVDSCVCECVRECVRACVRNVKETQILVFKICELHLQVYVAFGLYVFTHLSIYSFICIHT